MVAGGSIFGRNLVTNDGRGVEWRPLDDVFFSAMHARVHAVPPWQLITCSVAAPLLSHAGIFPEIFPEIVSVDSAEHAGIQRAPLQGLRDPTR